MAARLTGPPLEAVLAELVAERVVYFPIRHHSPACARHLERLLRDRHPEVILIEGPASFTPLIPLILHPGTAAPFAVYTSFAEEEKNAGEAPRPAGWTGPPRHAAYYPLCDYSPELVALRVGAELRAALRFIDLDYPDQVRAERGAGDETGAPRVGSLLAERHFRRSRYLQALARRAGCRDHNDLWDHLFETRLPGASAGAGAVGQFIRDVAAWCHFARADAVPEELAADGTLARESAMAAAVQATLAEGTGQVVVVTGGFHTVVLPRLVAGQAAPPRPAVAQAQPGALACLVRYGFQQLDALNGYSAGMPSPCYYDRLWRATAPADSPGPFAEVALSVLVELGQLTRRKKLTVALSAADEIAAFEQARRLAALRGHPGPTREDLLDGIRSCFVKGAMDAEGEVVLGLAHHALTGTQIGEVPPEAGVPPLVTDFRLVARKLRLAAEDSVGRKVSLDLYRKEAHRHASRFLRSLEFLEAAFCRLMAGPDFVKGIEVERLFEHWTYRWTPEVESRLIEASLYGATVEEATTSRLAWAIAELENTGRGHCAEEAVRMLVRACQMGLHRQTGRLIALVGAQVNEDPSLISLTAALNQLVLLWEAREPLEAQRLTEIPALIQTAYRRACYLLLTLADTPAEAAERTLGALLVVRDLLRSRAGQGSLDELLFYGALAGVLPQPRCPALLSGGVAGLLHGAGRLPDAELVKLLGGSLQAAVAPGRQPTAFLTGLLRASRELAWRQPALVRAVEDLLEAWSDEEFVRRIPDLRMAFADLTPQETDRVAAVVAGLHGGEQVGRLHRPDLDEAALLDALRLEGLVKQSLGQDGLAGWIEPPAPAAPPGEASP